MAKTEIAECDEAGPVANDTAHNFNHHRCVLSRVAPFNHDGGHVCHCGYRWGPMDLREVRVLRLQPGDVVVLNFTDRVTGMERDETLTRLAGMFPDHRCIVTERAELAVVRPDVADQIEDGQR